MKVIKVKDVYFFLHWSITIVSGSQIRHKLTWLENLRSSPLTLTSPGDPRVWWCKEYFLSHSLAGCSPSKWPDFHMEWAQWSCLQLEFSQSNNKKSFRNKSNTIVFDSYFKKTSYCNDHLYNKLVHTNTLEKKTISKLAK